MMATWPVMSTTTMDNSKLQQSRYYYSLVLLSYNIHMDIIV